MPPLRPPLPGACHAAVVRFSAAAYFHCGPAVFARHPSRQQVEREHGGVSLRGCNTSRLLHEPPECPVLGLSDSEAAKTGERGRDETNRPQKGSNTGQKWLLPLLRKATGAEMRAEGIPSGLRQHTNVSRGAILCHQFPYGASAILPRSMH